MSLLELVAVLSWSASSGALVAVLAGVPPSPSPRFGPRGAARRQALRRDPVFAAAEPVIRRVAAIVAMLPLAPLRRAQDAQLRRADDFLGLGPDEYSALALLGAASLGGIATGLAAFAETSPLLGVPAAACGLGLPALRVRQVIRSRLRRISRRLPHVIELTALCLRAGLDFPGALRTLTRRSEHADDPLTRELTGILERLELGHTRREALESFAERVPAPAVRDLVSAIVQAEQRGCPVAAAIQVQGRLVSLRRSVAAEEAAARAGVLMIIPTMLLLGCILLLLMGPFLVKGGGL